MTQQNSSTVDFVLPWVDGADPDWQESFAKFAGGLPGDGRQCRYRDWGTLRYLFRGFEAFTPWVRKIYFVTWGHLPPWLNTEHDKLRVVHHSDFLKEDNLPIFSCNPIEVNLHRIKGLSDRFVYFNDDTFILRTLPKEHFFSSGLPCDAMGFNAIYDSPIAHIKINDISIINRHFAKSVVTKENFFKIFNYKNNVIEMLKTLLLIPWPKITGFYDPHQPQPFLRSTFEEVWNKERDILERTSATKIRSSADVNQYLFRYWQLCQGNFRTRSFHRTFSKMIESEADADEFCRKIQSGRYEMICINDNVSDDSVFEQSKRKITGAFEKLFPEKSTFER